jgi:S-adenosyl-L-methionine hydrolase (adenosine-forming)
MAIVTLLTDFGPADSYVAEMKGVLLTYVPSVTLIDITHHVPPGDVRTAQYLLSRAWMFFPEGSIHVAVVDAGVGTARRLLGATRFDRFFLAPDNGLLSFLSANATFVSIPVVPEAAPTFHGRDVLAPAAAKLAAGGSLESLGPVVTDPLFAPLPISRIEGAAVVGEVLHIDHFGTLVSNLAPAALREGATIHVAGMDVGPLRRTFGDVAPGELVAFVGSGGTVEIAVRDGSAARKLGVVVGAEVRA